MSLDREVEKIKQEAYEDGYQEGKEELIKELEDQVFRHRVQQTLTKDELLENILDIVGVEL